MKIAERRATRKVRWLVVAMVVALQFGLVAQADEGNGLLGGDAALSASAAQIAPVANLSARLAYNTDRGAVVGAAVETDRLFGDHRLRFGVEASEDALGYDLNYLAPVLFGSNPRFGLGLQAARSDADDTFGFDSQTLHVAPRLTWSLGAGKTLAAYLGLSWSEIDNVAPTTSLLIRNDAGERSRQVIGLDYDVSDEIEAGMLRRLAYGLTAEFGQTDRDHEFMQLSSHLGAVWAFGAEDAFLLRAQLRGGTIHTTGGVSHIGDRLMLGASTIRGFAFGGFGPRDLVVPDEPALGGNHFAALRLDAQFAGFEALGGVLPGLFLDAGSLWGLDDTAGGQAGVDEIDDSARLRVSVGLSLDVQTGVGPIAFSYAHPVRREAQDRIQQFRISYTGRF